MIYLYILGRLIVSGYFLMNSFKHFKNLKGYTMYAESKGVPMAKIFVIATGVVLFVGGASILVGVYTQIGLLVLSLFLLVSAFKMHNFWKISDPMQKMGESVNFYKNLALMGTLLMLIPWSNVPIWDLWKLLLTLI
ncbi:MAG: DoxX family protein [bacterium]|nr:DoxX family protein [bacterium]